MESRSIDRTTLLNITLFVEAFLLLTATFWSQFAGIGLAPALLVDGRKMAIGFGAGLALAAVSLSIFYLGKRLKALGSLHDIIIEQIAPIFANVSLADVFVVAAVSGFCEEVLFRGVMQQQFGLLPTSLIFGLFHCPSLKHLSYGVWALTAGFMLGWLYMTTGSLWVPIFAHAVSNAVSLVFLRYGVKPPATPRQPDE